MPMDFVFRGPDLRLRPQIGECSRRLDWESLNEDYWGHYIDQHKVDRVGGNEVRAYPRARAISITEWIAHTPKYNDYEYVWKI